MPNKPPSPPALSLSLFCLAGLLRRFGKSPASESAKEAAEVWLNSGRGVSAVFAVQTSLPATHLQGQNVAREVCHARQGNSAGDCAAVLNYSYIFALALSCLQVVKQAGSMIDRRNAADVFAVCLPWNR